MAGSAPHVPGCRDLSLIGERVARSLFSAYSDRVGRPVTVTVYPPLSEGRTRAGFDAAAATAQRLGVHPSVLTIHEWGHAPDGRPWIVTDPQPPESVDTLLTMDGPLEVERALQVGVLLAGALETAHRAGIVHGDLQPDRLVFGAQGEPLLVETGLASFAVFPGLGALNNPVRYHAPPEVLERTEVTPATDVYSLATTLYALIAGRAPQQKPAEVTDSNASLLLRILQMPVPAIDRPDLPVGLEAALLGPLSASPGKRPQQAIDLAWLLQDVQRRNGLPVTEPVVLDLDAIAAGGSGAMATSVAPPPAFAGPAEQRWPVAEPEPPSPTIFPFAEGRPADAPAAGANPFGAPPGDAGVDEARTFPEPPTDAQWPSTWPADPDPDDGADTLWPSTWPADQTAGDAPAWAAAPVTDGELEAAAPSESDDHAADTARARGGDGGSIGDLPGFATGNGSHGTAPAGAFEAIQRPPELDELPAWYTDPLPNRPGGTPARGPVAASDDPSTAWSGGGPHNGGGPTAGQPPNGDTTAFRPVAPWDGPPQSPARDEHRLPGAGDELRSLFGEVVGGEGDIPSDAGQPAPDARPAPPDLDPLGPPQARPPIDLSQLDRPLGPAPFLPPSPVTPEARAPAGPDDRVPTRLPRRGEAHTWPSPGARAGAEAPARLPRAGDTEPETGPRASRPGPRQVAPAGGSAPAAGSRAAAAGPPAMPVIILIAVVVVLALGVAWLVLTGDDGGAPASERDPSSEDATPADVQVSEVPEGMQVTWSGSEDATYVVTVLSSDAAPRPLPATIGTSALVTTVEGGTPGPRCFTVALADAAPPEAGGATTAMGPASGPVCTPGATAEQMRQG